LAEFPGWTRDSPWGAPGPGEAPQSPGFANTKAKSLQCPGGPPCLQPRDLRSGRRRFLWQLPLWFCILGRYIVSAGSLLNRIQTADLDTLRSYCSLRSAPPAALP
jgi:hypothetical protein